MGATGILVKIMEVAGDVGIKRMVKMYSDIWGVIPENWEILEAVRS